jgi:RNA polymerase sigma factor (TIGR02999 family)
MSSAIPSNALLSRVSTGVPSALEELLPIVYDELRGLARVIMGDGRQGHTLQPTALVHEVYARLARQEDDWEGRRHFLSVAAKAMRHILADHARASRAQKRGGGMNRITLHDVVDASGGSGLDVVALDASLERLSRASPRSARVVELRFLGGLTLKETASVLDVSERTVSGEWQAARAWLRAELAAAS